MWLEERLQGVVASLDQGVGLALIRAFLFILFAGGVLGTYAWSQFRGLRDPGAMEQCQLARNLALGRGYRTQCIRPADLGRTPEPGEQTAFSDLRQAPLYPAVLAAGFKLFAPSFEGVGAAPPFAPETRVVVPLGFLFTTLTGLLVFLTGRRLFSARVGFYAMAAFFLTETVLAMAISGTARPLATLLCTGAVYTAILAADRLADDEQPAWLSLLLLAASALLCGLAFLTAYSLALLAPVLALYLAYANEEWQWTRASLFLAVTLLVAAPWLYRNLALSGNPFGESHRQALTETFLFPENTYERTVDPSVSRFKIAHALRLKFKSRLQESIHYPAPVCAGGLFACFFLASYFTRFGKAQANRLRWFMLVWLGLALGAGALGTDAALRMSETLLPTVLVFGTGFLIVNLERTEFLDEMTQTLAIWIAVALAALPAVLRVTGPAARFPYPPYYPSLHAEVCRRLGTTETVCTDIPWATAWYGDRKSLLLPRTVEDLVSIHTNKLPLAGVYLTTETGDRPYLADLVDGGESDWLPLLNGNVPKTFPFHYGFTLPQDRRDQIFLTDRTGELDSLPRARLGSQADPSPAE